MPVNIRRDCGRTERHFQLSDALGDGNPLSELRKTLTFFHKACVKILVLQNSSISVGGEQ